MIAQFREEIRKLPKPQPIILGFMVAFLGLLIFSYWKVIVYYWVPKWGITWKPLGWNLEAYYSLGPIVPLLALAVIYLRREALLKLTVQPSWWGLPIILFAMLCRIVGHWGYSHWLSSIAFPLFFIGLSLLLLGIPITRLLLYPILYLYFMIPLPSWAFDEITHPLQVWSTDIAQTILGIFYDSMYRLNDIQIAMPSGYAPQVAVECSGFRSVIALLLLACFSVELFNLSLWKKVAIIGLAIPIAILFNGFRIAVTLSVGNDYGEAAGKIAHDQGGLVVLIAAVFVLILLASWFERWSGWKKSKSQ